MNSFSTKGLILSWLQSIFFFICSKQCSYTENTDFCHVKQLVVQGTKITLLKKEIRLRADNYKLSFNKKKNSNTRITISLITISNYITFLHYLIYMQFFFILSCTIKLFITINIIVQMKKVARKQKNSRDKGFTKTSNTDSDSKFLPDSYNLYMLYMIKLYIRMLVF